MRPWTGALSLLFALAVAVPASAQEDGREAVALRTRDLLPVLNGEGAPAQTFTPQFLAEVPEPRLRAVAEGVRRQLGRAIGYRTVTMRDTHRAELVIVYERGTAHGGMAVDPGSGRIGAFWIDAVEPAEIAEIAALRSLDAIAAGFAALPGTVGFAVSDVGGREASLVASNAESPLAIGSAFKLVVLAELVRAVDTGERGWDDSVALGARELPAGGFRSLAPGARVTLRTLAEAMIRVSDNSATDVLLYELGRKRVEAMQAALGLRDPSRNVPFLSTMEAFKLKGVEGGALGRRYLSASVGERRRMLADEVARRTGADVGALFADGRPVMIESLEWFASATDLVRAMGWFAARAERPAAAEALRILALNPGPGASLRERFGYLGYKGGSEPGVLNMTVLARSKAGRWLALAATWNDPAAGVDEARFAALVTRALAIVSER